MTEMFDCRDTYAATLMALAKADSNVVVVVNDSVGSSKLTGFKKELPDQMVNVGIAEQNMVGVSAGLANGGKKPFVSGAGCFLSARAMEQIKADLAYSRHHVVLAAQSPGVAYGALGATHHSIEDVAWMRVLPNMTVLVPADPAETEQALRWAYGHDGPVYIRISRAKVPAVHPEGWRFEVGKATVLREGSDVALLANGTVLQRTIAAATLLAERGVEARVLSMGSVKPIDAEAVIAAARETRGLVTVEEGLAAGGLGGAVAEVLTEHAPARLVRLGLTDEFAPTGKDSWILDHFGMSPEGIADTAARLVKAV